MDFQLVLSSCYKEGISPFLMYSKMMDFSKNDVSVSKKCLDLYQIYKQEDIFSRVLACKEGELDLLCQKYSSAQRECVLEIVRLLHPSWVIAQAQKPVSTENGAIVKRQGKGVKKTQKGNGTQPVPTPKPVQTPVNAPQQKQVPPKKQPRPSAKQPSMPKGPIKKTGIGKPSIIISSIQGDLEIVVSTSVRKIKVYSVDNGQKTEQYGCITFYGRDTKVDLTRMVADKKLVTIPKGDYNTLEITSARGDIVVKDKLDSFYKLSMDCVLGKIDVTTCARKIDINASVSDIALKYWALQEKPELKITNQLGDIMVKTFNTYLIQDKLKSTYGKTQCKHIASSFLGHVVRLKITSTYGSIYVV